MQDFIKITGVFHCKVFQNGVLIQEYTDKNLVVNAGKKKIADSLISGTIQKLTKIGLGTSNATPDVANTLLTDEFIKDATTIVSITNGVELNWDVLTSEANGFTYREFGLMFEDKVLLARKVGLTIAKNNTISITGKWTITIS